MPLGGLVGARYYDERQRARQLEMMCNAYRDRIDVLVPEFLSLIDAVLHARNIEAFSQAWRVQTLIDEFTEKQMSKGA